MSTRETRTTDDSIGTGGEVRIAVFDTEDLDDAFDAWNSLSKFERWLALRDPDENAVEDLEPDTLDPEDRNEWWRAEKGIARDWADDLLAHDPPEAEQTETRNTTTDGLNSYLADNLDPNQAVNESATHLAVGTDGASGTGTGDTTLNTEVYRTAVTDSIDNGKDLTTSTFLDSAEANGYSLTEVGLFTDDGTGSNILLNHAKITTIAKDDSKTVTVDVELQFRAA